MSAHSHELETSNNSYSQKIYIRIIALLNSYVEVEVTHTIPGVSAIRFGRAEVQMARATIVVLQVHCALVPIL